MTLEIIRQYAARRVDGNQLLHALVQYDNWYAPADYAATAFQTSKLGNLVICGEHYEADDELWLFTSREALLKAHAAMQRDLGVYAGGLAGIDLFEHIPAQVERVAINPMLPAEQSWLVRDHAVHVARLYGKALGLERSLRAGAEDLIDRAIAFDAYAVLKGADGRMVTATSHVLAFTTRDAALQALADLGGGELHLAYVTARDVFAGDHAGVIMNCADPDPHVVDRELCRLITECLDDGAELTAGS
jgi:hypothetical protein